MALGNLSYIAGGNIYPRRFVYISAGHTVSQVNSTSVNIEGVMQDGIKGNPGADVFSGYAAQAGDANFQVFGELEECWLDIGIVAVTAGNPLKSDVDGKGVPMLASSTEQWIGAIAEENCPAGGICKVRVNRYIVGNTN